MGVSWWLYGMLLTKFGRVLQLHVQLLLWWLPSFGVSQDFYKVDWRILQEMLTEDWEEVGFLGDLLRKNFCLVDQQYPIIPSQGMNPTTLQIISKRRFSSDKENPICNLSESGPNHLLSQQVVPHIQMEYWVLLSSIQRCLRQLQIKNITFNI